MTIHFPDISHYQAGLSLAGAPAVIAKATQGVGYVDPSYLDFRSQAAHFGIPFAAYHWLDTTDAGAQARHCYSIVGAATPLMIDDEQGTINVAHTIAFVMAYRALGGIVHLEYAPRWVWANSGSPDLRPLSDAGLALVSSSYPTAGYTATGPGWAPYGGVTPAQWQYSDAHPFGGQHVDFNAYNGTAAEWLALITGADMALTTEDHAAIRADVIAALNAATPWQSAGVGTWAGQHGWNPVSLRSAVEYMWQRTMSTDPAAVATDDAARDAALLAAIQSLATAGGVDAAPITAALAELRATVTAQAAELHTLRTQLAAGAAAEAAALTAPQA